MAETDEKMQKEIEKKIEALRTVMDKYAPETINMMDGKVKEILIFILEKSAIIKKTENTDVVSGYLYGSVNALMGMVYKIMQDINPDGAYMNAKIIIENIGEKKNIDIIKHLKEKTPKNIPGYIQKSFYKKKNKDIFN